MGKGKSTWDARELQWESTQEADAASQLSLLISVSLLILSLKFCFHFFSSVLSIVT